MAGGDRGEGRDHRRWRHKNLCSGYRIDTSEHGERKQESRRLGLEGVGGRFQSLNEIITSSGKYWEV